LLKVVLGRREETGGVCCWLIDHQQPPRGPERYATHAADCDERNRESSGRKRSAGITGRVVCDRSPQSGQLPEPAGSVVQEASGFSASVEVRMKKTWSQEMDTWSRRDLNWKQYVYL
jgi:hypothetical protein